MLHVKIVHVPEGEAPLEVREKWVGVELHDAIENFGVVAGLFTGQLMKARQIVIVSKNDALEELARKDENAWLWWMRKYNYHPRGDFAFNRDEVEVLS